MVFFRFLFHEGLFNSIINNINVTGSTPRHNEN